MRFIKQQFLYCFTGTFLKQIWFLACEKQFRRVYLLYIFKLPYTQNVFVLSCYFHMQWHFFLNAPSTQISEHSKKSIIRFLETLYDRQISPSSNTTSKFSSFKVKTTMFVIKSYSVGVSNCQQPMKSNNKRLLNET